MADSIEATGSSLAAAFELLAREFAITLSDADVWRSIGLALLLGLGCWVLGAWVARTVGLLPASAPAGESLGVGLAVGLVVLAAWWAAVRSGGRSSFTPVAVGFAASVLIAAVHRGRRRATRPAGTSGSLARPTTSLLATAIAGAGTVVAVALIYGSTMAPSPRDGVQPVEFNDEAYYAVLGRDLASTGTESTLSTSGFSDIPELPAQTWYHWGELWLASGVIALADVAPLPARFFVVLPLVLLASAALSGTIVRTALNIRSRRAYAFGFVACLLLAPVPLIPGPFFSSWAVGMLFGITIYGLGAVAALLGLYSLIALPRWRTDWAFAMFVGCCLAVTLPAHIAIALLGAVAGATFLALRLVRLLRAGGRRLPLPIPYRRTLVAASGAVAATIAWGIWTGHGLGPSAPPIVAPFNASWRESVAITVLGAGTFAAIGVAWLVVRRVPSVEADLYVCTTAVVLAGAVAWGARLGEFTSFYLFYGGIAVIATPVAAVAVRRVWAQLRETRHFRMTAGLVVLSSAQLMIGLPATTLRMQQFGPHDYEPTPLALIEAIRQLPIDAKIAYTCRPLDEHGFGVPQLVSIDAHTGRRVVPMCFQAETLSTLIGAPRSTETPNRYFPWAPQRALYPNATARPSPEVVADFLASHGIDYIYADPRHPNTLIPDAVPIAASGDARVLRVP